MEATLQRSPLLPMIRSRVKERLTASAAFNALPKDTQRQIAHDTVNALHYIVGGPDGTLVPESVVLGGNSTAFAPADALAGPVSGRALAPGARRALAPGGQAGGQINTKERKGFGEAADTGSNEFTEMIANVNFPAFVGGLIDGVFNSIVTTSIKQMEAYAEMVRNVSKSVDQYMKDNVTPNHARDYLAERYPEFLQVDITGESPRLRPREGHSDDNLPDFFSDLGLKSPVTGLDDDMVEEELVPAARRRIAMDRQQTLATMVMMGVNRLVVTNGTIEASCLFELDTTDVRKRGETRTTDFESGKESGSEWGADSTWGFTGKGDSKWGWRDRGRNVRGEGEFAYDQRDNWYSKGSERSTAKFKMTTASSRSDENTIDMHAKLGGKVKVNFKSDYFPMEKMIDALQVNQIREKTQAGIAPPVQPPAPPPLPPMPAIAAPGVAPGAAPPPAPAPAPAPRPAA